MFQKVNIDCFTKKIAQADIDFVIKPCATPEGSSCHVCITGKKLKRTVTCEYGEKEQVTIKLCTAFKNSLKKNATEDEKKNIAAAYNECAA